MHKIRQALAARRRGDQALLERLRCVDQSTVSRWAAACELLDAIEGKCAISHDSKFQPSHATEVVRAYRKKAESLSADEIIEWIERVGGGGAGPPQAGRSPRRRATGPTGGKPVLGHARRQGGFTCGY
jgi:hypothetical protein